MPDNPADLPPQDPVTASSLSLPLLVSAVLLVLVLIWSLYDEAYGERPWKRYQKQFVKSYTAFLQRQLPKQAQQEKQLRSSPEFQKLEQDLALAERAAQPKLGEIDREVAGNLDPEIMALNRAFTEVRGQVQELTYQAETASSEGSKQSLVRKIAAVEAKPIRTEFRSQEGGVKMVVFQSDAELEAELTRAKQRKAELETNRAELLKFPAELRKRRDEYLKDHLAGLTEVQMQGLLRKMQHFSVEIKQIHVAEGDIVDRCESCHLGVREPLTITKADMGGDGVFVSHPKPELLKFHDPERFGCTPCHNGNGRATTSVEKAHGKNEHWMWPLFRGPNIESGCQQCHAKDIFLPFADVLSQGKQLYGRRGCIGCHRFDGYDTETDQLQAAEQAMVQKRALRKEDQIAIERYIAEGDRAPDNATARQLYGKAEGLRVTISGIDKQIEELNLRERSLLLERKMVGPNLEEARAKLNKAWIPVWLEDPQAFRPSTRMPKFRLNADERQAIAAFIWQDAMEIPVALQPKGDAAKGKELFETRGCLACHAVGEGKDAMGGNFAANLSREGEKANYDYLVRWIQNPRLLTKPYCPLEKRDLGPDDYARHGLAFVFDMDHTKCPNDGHELQVQQMNVMPSLRLSLEESRDIASYLITLKKKEPGDYPPAPFMDDPSLPQKGFALVRHYGCAGCHEFAGLEEELRIGTDLTKEGSKPIERLDFGLLTPRAKREGWYNAKGFLEHKLSTSAIYDEGKILKPLEGLRMPEPSLKPEELTALATFLMGSVDSTLPPSFLNQPEDRRRDIQEGWKVVEKYNCMGCHVLRIGQRSALMDVPRYQNPDWKEQLPPFLIGEGARVDPSWLAKFLANPSLSETDVNRNGVRPYLKARMPTFFFSEGEIGRLVRFFLALSGERQPYISPKLEPLTEQERTLARQLFTSQAAPCLKCHATGDAAHDEKATAPSFVLAKTRLQPDWTRRWMLDPAMMNPGTNMPSDLFRAEGSRMIFAGPLPPGFEQYKKDHADLLVRYMFEFTPEEQRRLAGR